VAQHQSEAKRDNLESAKKPEKNEMMDDSMSVSDSRTDEKNSSFYEENKSQKKNTYENMYKFISIEEMICQSIQSIPSSDGRKKIANSILLVGGGAKFRNFIDMLEDKLIEKLTAIDNEIDRVEVLNIEPKTITWIGGSIIPKLDSAKDMFISRERWMGEIEKNEEVNQTGIDITNNNNSSSQIAFDETGKILEQQIRDKTKKKDKHMDGGMRILREKAPFVW
jgi:actin-related protein